jgi:hypothetical protein
VAVSADSVALEVAGHPCSGVPEWTAAVGGCVLTGAVQQSDQLCLAED